MKMKRCLATAIVIVMLCSFIPAYAANSSDTEPPNTNMGKINSFLKMENPQTLPPISAEEKAFVFLWKQVKQNGYMSVNEKGLIVIDASTEKLADSSETYNYFNHLVNVANNSIRLGLIRMNPATLELENNTLTEETFRRIAESESENRGIEDKNNIFRIDPHTCNNPKLNLGYLVYTNYNTIKTYKDDMTALQRTNPDVDPWLTTVGYWIGHIKEGGPWDYKRESSGYGPYNKVYCCSYSGHTYQHRTAEWIGNYNYGYTGSLLFDLKTLHAGSYAAAKFKSTDRDDWPAIDEGFYDAFRK